MKITLINPRLWIDMIRRGNVNVVEYVVAPEWMPISTPHLLRVGPLKIEW